ncbi:methyltransferase regulatory domain-containing protein [Sphingomonas cavernae]|uniref:methyltransferase regulatory domain-containing protein n=1 Tax=Sphingomonas cavernae TaxID=2320861 RepID=UPI0016007882|nr:class I SAM-dependent methyltransferase [Sphingomonas cavernae]
MSDIIQQIRAEYDSTPYESFPFPQSAPPYLAAIAHLFGLKAPDPEKARILELGCASGGNIIPLAIRHPHARVTGIDLSQVQIETGQRIVKELALDNIELRLGDLTEIGPELGTFDYIICHGVFSWVPAHVQAAILRICKDNLAADGIAYISYNTYPGWKAKEVIRDAMILRGKDPRAGSNQLGFARGIIDFLKDVAPRQSLLAHILEEHSPVLRQSRDYYLQHEFLEACNSPIYFSEFLAAANEVGLGYLAEANLSTMFASNYGAKIAEPLLKECEGNQARLEQYLDFVTNRTFRQTVLVHKERTDQIRYGLDAERLTSLHVAAFLPAHDASPAPLDSAPRHYGPQGLDPVTLRTPVVKVAADILTEQWPATLSFTAIASAVKKKLGKRYPAAAEDELVNLIEVLVIQNRAKISLKPVGAASDKPAGKIVLPEPWRSYGAATANEGTPHIANAWHEAIMLDPAEQHLLARLDGSASRDALVGHLIDCAEQGKVSFEVAGERLTDPERVRSGADEHVERVLSNFAKRFIL